LAQLGWSGVCVEGSPVNFQKLLDTHKGNNQIALVMAPVSADTSRMVLWYDSGGGVSTTETAHKLRWELGSRVRYTSFFVYTMPLSELFARFGYDFTFINIDVESTNLQMFAALPWTLLTNLRLICVEHDGHNAKMAHTAGLHGFKQIGFNAENILLAR
jgi:hypothetical protein